MSVEKFSRLFKEKTGASFKDLSLLKKALTHDSCGDIGKDFERMEFLGDACLELTVAELLFRNSDFSEGRMSQMRSSLTRKESLAEILRSWNAEKHFILGKGMDRDCLADTIYADYLESFFGALFLDQGHEAVRKCIINVFQPLVDEVLQYKDSLNNPKSRLQEYVMARGKNLPKYIVVEKTGSAHQPTYIIHVHVLDGLHFEGKASSIKGAEQAAAKKALESLNVQNVE